MSNLNNNSDNFVCIGTLITELDDIIKCYKILYKYLINNQIDKLHEIFDMKTLSGNLCIPDKPEKMVLIMANKKIIIESLCVKKVKYLQKKDNDDKLLYFVGNPAIINYNDNKLTTKKTAYPAYYYVVKNRITPNYSYAINTVHDTLTLCTDSDICLHNAKTVMPYNIYVCTYQNNRYFFDVSDNIDNNKNSNENNKNNNENNKNSNENSNGNDRGEFIGLIDAYITALIDARDIIIENSNIESTY